MASRERVKDALARIETWMSAHAPLLVENLAPGAEGEELDAAEGEVGFALPTDLRALWSIHDGQRDELNGFVGALDLFGVELSLSEREGILLFVSFLREDPSSWAEAGVTEAEALSDDWLPIAGRDSDSLVVSGVSGRVFTCGKDAPPLHLIAASVAEWLEQYATRIEDGVYEVEEGFGDYFLSRSDGMH